MSRRWKIVIALAVVGLAGFLVWAFRSDPNRGVAIQFLGYETNGPYWAFPMRLISGGEVLAHFCLTNGSDRAIACDAYRGYPFFSAATKTKGGWTNLGAGYFGRLGSFDNIVLSPAKSTRFSVPVPDLSQPLRVSVPYSTNVPPPDTRGMVVGTWIPFLPTPTPVTNAVFATVKKRVSGWLGRNKGPPSVSITIQDR